ncbi:DivIVA domain-containing protein [Micromonospora sp. WMMC250]|uniref:DivIVA domain-containing protein n=1 Tax=Micromonospora sp. WMMC250 TaxID=3014781 RepID=UPI0022B64FEF|nr:DivIVA domain-containing protein [Micromonospora sp. WMMC250]MCZ7374883.1 DivIVA domain-containing protein [Micromonospora sp. WMMC250]
MYMNAGNQRPTPVGDGATYRSAAYTSLLPWQVRERRFAPTGLGRRGLNPDDVYAFLDRVAGDMAAVYAALAESRRETARIKAGLRRWQTEQARARNERDQAR